MNELSWRANLLLILFVMVNLVAGCYLGNTRPESLNDRIQAKATSEGWQILQIVNLDSNFKGVVYRSVDDVGCYFVWESWTSWGSSMISSSWYYDDKIKPVDKPVMVMTLSVLAQDRVCIVVNDEAVIFDASVMEVDFGSDKIISEINHFQGEIVTRKNIRALPGYPVVLFLNKKGDLIFKAE